MFQVRDETSTAEPRSQFSPRRLVPLLLISVVAAAAIAAALMELARHQLMLLAAPDRMTYDWRIALFSHRELETRKDIALLLIGDRTLAQYNYQLPLDRGLLAQIVRAVDAAGAKAIGFDIIFDRPTDKDDLLIEAIRSSKTPVVLGGIDSRYTGIEPQNLAFQQAFFEKAGNPPVGHLYFFRPRRGFSQPDQVIRMLPPRSSEPDQIRKTFTEALLEASGRQV